MAACSRGYEPTEKFAEITKSPEWGDSRPRTRGYVLPPLSWLNRSAPLCPAYELALAAHGYNPMTNTFLAAGENGTCLLSTDGKLWKAVRTGKDGEVFNSTCIASGRAVTSARYGGRNTFTTSTDGTTWKDSEFDAKYSKYIRGLFHFKDQILEISRNRFSSWSIILITPEILYEFALPNKKSFRFHYC